MRAFGALRGFPFFGRNSFRRQQQRQQGNKASQAGGQPLSNGSSTTEIKFADSSHRCANIVSCLAFPWPRQDAQAMSCNTIQCLPSKDVFTLQSWLTHPVMKAAYTSGSLSLAGDLIAQLYSKRGNHVGSESIAWDRSARMGTFGLFFYGPYQHWWYGLLNQQWPLKSTSHFLTKVTLNQLALGPIVTTVVFTWNLLLQQRASEVPDKLKRDLVPTMVNGWKFWLPAASINFWVVPLQSQVLYMSVCGLLWTAYLSYSSNSRPQLSKT